MNTYNEFLNIMTRQLRCIMHVRKIMKKNFDWELMETILWAKYCGLLDGAAYVPTISPEEFEELLNHRDRMTEAYKKIRQYYLSK